MASSGDEWSQERINFLSDVIATAVLLKSDRPADATGEDSQVGEVESTFLVQRPFKGEIRSGEKILVRHFEDAIDLRITTFPGAHHPDYDDTYLLYLRLARNHTFEPTTGLGEPRVPRVPIQISAAA